MNTPSHQAFTATEPFAEGWKIVTKAWTSYLMLFVTVFLFSIVYAVIGALLVNNGLPLQVETVISILLSLYMSMVSIQANLAIARGQKAVLIDWFKIKGKTFLHMILVTILLVVLLIPGFVFLILPGIFLLLMFGYSRYSVVDAGTTAIEALRDSYHMTMGNKLQIFLYYLMLGVIYSFALVASALPLLFIVGFVVKDGDVSMANFGPLLIAGIIGLVFLIVVGVTLSMVNMAGQAYMYLKMREYTPAPKV